MAGTVLQIWHCRHREVIAMEERASTLAGLLGQLQVDGIISSAARRRTLSSVSLDAQSLRVSSVI